LAALVCEAVGIITVAPMVIGLAEALRGPPPRNEIVEGVVSLLVLAGMTVIIVFLPPEPWKTVRPIALLFPMLAWLAARCQPGFAATAVFIVSLAIIWTITFGSSHFRIPALPIDDRITACQAAILIVALGTYFLAALFAERRQHVRMLKEGQALLQEALAAGAVMAFECSPMSDLVKRSDNAAQILGFDPRQPLTAAQFLARTTSRALRRTITGTASIVPPRSPFVSFAPTAARYGSKKPRERNLTWPDAFCASRA
jgi:hypothetical protein